MWIPHHDLCCLAVENVSEIHLWPWGIERSGLIGTGTKEIGIVLFLELCLNMWLL